MNIYEREDQIESENIKQIFDKVKWDIRKYLVELVSLLLRVVEYQQSETE